MTKREIDGDPLPPRPRLCGLLTLAGFAALAGPAAHAEPMLQHQSLYRNEDMTRWIDNYVELGAGYNSADSYKFGEWNGLRDEGAHAIVGFNWLQRDRDNDARYWRINGSGLGLETRKLSFEGGEQGRWRLAASADRLLRSELDSARFMHSTGLGTTRLGGVATVPVNAATPLTPYRVEQGRDFYRLSVDTTLSANWDFQLKYREDVRDGSRVAGLSVPTTQTGGGFNFPYPVDDHTQQIDAQIAYADTSAQLQLAYHYSRYENNLAAVEAQNLLGATPALTRLSLMPSNDYHQISATGAYRITRDTRVTTKLSYGLSTQDEPFLDFSTALPGLKPATASLDGELVRTLFDLALTTQPTGRSSLKLGYQYFDHDNRTPIADFRYAPRDAAAQDAVGSTSDRQNAPISRTENKLLADGDYRLGDNTTLRALVEYTEKTYRLSDRAQTETTRGAVEVRRPILDTLMGSLGYEHSRRTGSDYDRYAFIRASFNADQLAVYHPSTRSYLYSDYRQNKLRANASWAASETINLQGGVEGYQQEFDGPDCGVVNAAQAATFNAAGVMPDICLGRSLAEGGAANIDVQWQPEPELAAFAFANYALLRTEQTGRPWTTVANAVDATRTWFATLDYEDRAVGTGFKWQPVEGVLDIGGHYVYGHGKGKTKLRTAPGFTASVEGPLPDITSTLQTVQLYAKWNVSRKLALRLNYLYESLEIKDWSLLNPATGQPYGPFVSSNLVWTGQTAPHYENHAVGVSLALHGW